MAARRVERGEVNERVAKGIRALRERQRITLADLSKRLTALGRPILPTGLTKIEQGGEVGRRVDVDDLVALALALGVTPNRLLFGGDAGPEPIPLTDTVTVSARDAWEWATSQSTDVFSAVGGVDEYAFDAECRPHRRRLSDERRHRHRDVLARIFTALDDACAAGLTLDELQSMLDLHFRTERAQEGDE